ncbi:MAG: PAC2 family protein [Gemmatimonadetes bacterium]|nr:PAC2 family protein [Gemmatimonadota bacterium]
MRIRAFEVEPPEPPLRSPHCVAMLRPWVNVGNVGALVLRRLGEMFGTSEIGRLARPSEFYDYTRYRPQMTLSGDERVVTVPTTLLYAARRESPPDLLLLHMLEPHARAEDFNDSVIDLLRHFGVSRWVLVGGMYDSVPHTRPLWVTGSARGWDAPFEPGGVRLRRGNYQGPTSLTSNLSQRAHDEEGLETLSLIVHLPLYLRLDDDYQGAARLLRALAPVYDLADRLPEDTLGEQQYAQVTPALAANPQLAQFVERLEHEYERRSAGEDTAPGGRVDLPEDIERFLRELEGRSGGDRPGPPPGRI